MNSAARLDFVAHERLEDLVGLDRIFHRAPCRIVRVCGSIVVFQSWSGFISPRPL